jgi:ketosteroid isomerase-like protein
VSHIETVQAMYEAFGRGDVPGILEHLAEDVRWDEWESPSAAQQAVPYLAPRRGRAGVEDFFKVVGALEFHDFAPLSFLEGPGEVAARIRIDLTVPATGKRFADEEIHLWTFGPDGKVTSLRHFVDTLTHTLAHRA